MRVFLVIFLLFHYLGTLAQDSVQIVRPAFVNVNTQPQFTGGVAAMYKWINQHTGYPVSSKKKGVRIKVYTRFIVEKDGTTSHVEILKGPDNGFHKKTERVILDMPPWQPATIAGKPVRCNFTLPIIFQMRRD